MREGGGGVREIEPRDREAIDFAQDEGTGEALLEPKGVGDRSGEDDFGDAGFKGIAGSCERSEHINDDDRPFKARTSGKSAAREFHWKDYFCGCLTASR